MKNQGITLMELVVVIAILTLMGALVLVSVTSMGLTAQVNAAANQILDIAKETRHNSVSVKSFGGTLFPSYGLYFNLATPQDIIIYADCLVDDNGDLFIDDQDTFIYEPATTPCNGASAYVKTITLNSDVTISAIRSVSFGSTVSETKFHMEFIRPEPTVWISDSTDTLIPAGRIEIDIISTRGGSFTKTLVFWTTGQFAILES